MADLDDLPTPEDLLAANAVAQKTALNTQIALTDYFKPTGATYETVPHWSPLGAGGIPSSGTLVLAGIGLPAGLTISSITFVAVSPNFPSVQTNLWYGLFDMDCNMLAVTVDDLTGSGNPWVDPTHTLPIAADATGPVTSFTTTYEGLHYLGILNAAAGPVELTNGVPQIAWDVPPFLFSDSTTGMTAPPAFPFQALAPVASGGQGITYAYVS